MVYRLTVQCIFYMRDDVQITRVNLCTVVVKLSAPKTFGLENLAAQGPSNTVV